MPDDPARTGAAWATVLDLEQLRVEIRRGSGLPAVQQPALAGLAGADDDVSFVVGGNRAAELRLTGGPSGDVHWLTARLTPNGDDPYPTLEMLLYEAPGNLVSRLDELDALLAGLG